MPARPPTEPGPGSPGRIRVGFYCDAHEVGGAEVSLGHLVGLVSSRVEAVVMGTNAAVVERIAACRQGVATAYLVVTVVMQPLFLRLTARAVGLRTRDWLPSVTGVMQAGLIMLAIVLAVRELLLETGLPVGARLAAVTVIGALAYVPLVAWRAPEVGAELRELRARRRHPTGRSGDAAI